jgi:hypothetical protein
VEPEGNLVDFLFLIHSTPSSAFSITHAHHHIHLQQETSNKQAHHQYFLDLSLITKIRLTSHIRPVRQAAEEVFLRGQKRPERKRRDNTSSLHRSLLAPSQAILKG